MNHRDQILYKLFVFSGIHFLVGQQSAVHVPGLRVMGGRKVGGRHNSKKQYPSEACGKPEFHNPSL